MVFAISCVPVVGPGHTTFTRMPFFAFSMAAVRVRAITPALLGPYAPKPGAIFSPPMEAVLTIAPFPCCCIWISSYFRQKNSPRRLVSIT